MKTSKKAFSIFLSLLMVALMLPLAVVPASAYISGECGENVTWEYEDDTGELVISGTGAMYDYLPGTSTSPFRSLSGLKSVRIESGVTTVGAYMFQNCTNLKEVTLPESMETIGAHAFRNSGLLTLVLPKGVHFLGEFSFAECSSLKEVSLYADIEIIGNSAFWKCNNLKTVYFYGNEDQWDEITIEEYNTWFKEYTTRVYLVEVILIAGEGGFVGENGDKRKEVIRVPYAELIEICARPSEGYHFVAWIYNNMSFDTEEIVDFRPNRNMTITATFAKDEAPPEPQPENVCKWCGQVHEGFFGAIVGFFHNIFAAIFGAKY